ncbi:hypothetical protein, variant 1 [Aphanomyces invadans]|uniref:Magnesium transporter n=1 Tax=Aphanomyces invadans TaxID=157072 RepID=A0A024UJP4_9STRA|nr:hypothetical protein, variant 1 [Aphanomyces invadans]ETW05833.1 hypothetical protein, variant 1 [Aphanomyces invadans]|eukprot:XP_008865610.1 hypothetical protein, variant 1 [Aphanomyces invadans]
MAHGGFGGGTTLVESLMHNDMLVSKDGEILGMNAAGGKRLALRFDTTGNSDFIDLSRHDVLTMIQSCVKSMAIPDNTIRRSRMDSGRPYNRSRTRLGRDGPIDIPAVHMRDIRKMDNIFSTSNEPSITVRQQAILVNCDPVRAVITRETCLVFLPDGADSLVYHLRTNMQQHIADAIAFEFAAVEAILATICRLFSTECDRIVPKGRAALDKVTKDDSMMSELENLRSIKNEMSSLESRVGGMRRLLMAFLENEEDLHMMYLTKLYNEPELVHNLFSFDTEDAESFLEVYLQEIYGTQTRVALMANNILNTESIVMLKLDSKRNFLLSVDLSLTLLGTLVALPTFIVGGFGMNLNSTIQDTDYIFWIVFGVCVAIMVLGYVYTQQYLKRQGINMSWKY